MRVLSLFCGAGGLDWGFEQNASFTIVEALDKDKHAISTYNHNFASKAGKVMDLANEACLHYFEDNFANKIDGVIGGPPCQGFSRGGKMNPDDDRSQMIFRFLDIVECVRAKWFVMENVPHLQRSSKFRNIRKQYQDRVETLNYILTPIFLNAKDYGVPQSRERVFYIGTRSDQDIHLPPAHDTKVCVRDVLESLNSKALSSSTTKSKIVPAKNPVLRGSAYSGMLFNGSGRPIPLDGFCPTLAASMGGNRTPILDERELQENEKSWIEWYYEHLRDGGAVVKTVPSHIRRITVDEAKVLQSFPDDFVFLGPTSSQYKQIGNSVCPKISIVVAQIIQGS
jgi:DNA (cytosine-5)-methyltransferase 1